MPCLKIIKKALITYTPPRTKSLYPYLVSSSEDCSKLIPDRTSNKDIRGKGVKAELRVFMNSTVAGDEWSPISSARFTPGKELPAPIGRIMSGPQNRL